MYKIYKNILTKAQQKNLLSFVKKQVKDLGSDYPGLQSNPDLHEHKEMKDLMTNIKKYMKDTKVIKCWANYTDGSYILWHNHNSKYSIVYYLYNPEKIGVMFKLNDYDINYTEGEENSMIIFDSKNIHSVPNSFKKIKRYSIALELI